MASSAKETEAVEIEAGHMEKLFWGTNILQCMMGENEQLLESSAQR